MARSWMARSSLPPGFRFHPTDVELVMYYLKRKIMGKRFHFEAISEIDMYKFAPWDLPDKACLKSRDLEWYFFCPRDRKYGTGQRVNRTADVGYWKTTGKDRRVYYDLHVVGMRKTLIFHTGKAPHGGRTDWVVHEYRLEDKRLTDAGISQENYVICRLFKKSGLGPKNGAQYGAPYVEEDWEDDDEQAEGGFSSSISVTNHVLAAANASQNIHNSQPGDISALMDDTSAIQGNLVNVQMEVEHSIPAAAIGGACIPEPSGVEYTSIDNGEAIPPEDPIIRLLCQELEEENESQFHAIFKNPDPSVHNQAHVAQRAYSFDDPRHTARQLPNTAHSTARQLSNVAHNFTTPYHPDLIQDHENYLLQIGCQSQNDLDDRGGFIEIDDLWSM